MRVLFILYLLLIHSFFVVTLIKTDIIKTIQQKAGYSILMDEMSSHYYEMLSFHRRIDHNLKKNSIIFIGDSHVQGLAVSAVSADSVNFGVGHDTTLGVKLRLPFYSSIHEAKTVVLAIGVNDIRRRNNVDIINNFNQIIQIIPEHIPLMISAILPINELSSNRVNYNNRIVKLNKQIEKLASKNDNIYFIDITNKIIDSENNLSNLYDIGDGVHLNKKGYAIWIDSLKRMLDKIK